MVLSITMIILAGIIADSLFKLIRLPGLLGMLLVGIIAGPKGLNIISPVLIGVSLELRQLALIVILLRAGLQMRGDTIKKVGKTALLMCFLPATFECIGITLIAPSMLGITRLEGAILGAILGAVSPAVVVPYMIELTERNRGTAKGIPSLIMASASIDDVYVIVLFTSLMNMYFDIGQSVFLSVASIPISIIIGVFLGFIIGTILCWFFKNFHMRDTTKVLIITGLAVLIISSEALLKNIIPVSGLLSIMTIGAVILERYEILARRLSAKYSKVWVAAEILLFVLVGAQVDITIALDIGIKGVVVIFGGLAFRSLGTFISVYTAKQFNWKERLFCVLAYLPKATVQAAIGSIPLAAGVEAGSIILAVAVLAILITAPIGAIAIKYTENILLEDDVPL